MKQHKRLVIIGAGGHGRVAADIAGQVGYEQICFLDDMPVPGIEGNVESFTHYLDSADFFVAIGNSAIREKISKILAQSGANVTSLIHPRAVLSDTAMIGRGVIIMAGAVVNTGAILGDGVIINTCASVDHDCRIGDFVHVAVGAHICGTVEIGHNTWIGAGATVINNISVCDNCMIGAGAVVIEPIVEKGTYVGVPARKLK